MKRCVCILTHGRPDTCTTVGTLRRRGYGGEIILILDDEDETVDDYRRNYPDCRIVTFSKADEMRRPFSAVDNFGIRGSVVYARNATWDIMRREGYGEFVMLDDDYSEFEYKWLVGVKLMRANVRRLDRVFDAYFEYLHETDSDVVCMAQGGDFIGGGESSTVQRWFSRKAMNVYFFRTERPYRFTGAMNDDVNTYLLANARGRRVFTVPCVSIVQRETQQQGGGLTGMYEKYGTFCKSFCSVVVAPSSVKISRVGDASRGHAYWRVHHNVSWRHAAPKILNECWVKKS